MFTTPQYRRRITGLINRLGIPIPDAHGNQTAPDGTLYYVINKDPLLISIPYGLHYPFLKFLSKRRRSYFLFWLWSATESEELLQIIKNEHVGFKQKFPRSEYIFLCNSPRQYDLFGKADIPRVLCNHNAFLDEAIFRTDDTAVKRFDAIYTAKIEPFKRHQLAAKISRLAIAAHPFGFSESYGAQLRDSLPHATWLTKNFEKDRFMIPTEEMYKFINQARVGLCLSAEEGAMYASVEYLLCGVPLVSTRSIGGRDVFFEDDYVKIVDDTPDAVAAGVEEMIHRRVEPSYIREKTIQKMKGHRATFIDLIQTIYSETGVNRKFSDEWEGIFTNKLLKRQYKIEI